MREKKKNVNFKFTLARTSLNNDCGIGAVTAAAMGDMPVSGEPIAGSNGPKSSAWQQAFYETVKRLREDGSPEKLDLSAQSLDDEDVSTLAKALTKNITLGGLDLGNNSFSVSGVAALSASLAVNMRLAILDLSHNFLGPKGFACLGRSLGKNDALRTLLLNGCGITGDAASDRAIDTSGLFAFSKDFVGNRGLEHLELRGNLLTDYGESETGMAALLEAVFLCPTLRTLDLGDNGLGPSGAEIVSKALRENHTLDRLGFGHNRIQSQGAHSFAELLGKNCFLGKLDLQNNDLCVSGTDFSGAEALARSFEASMNRQDENNRDAINDNYYKERRGSESHISYDMLPTVVKGNNALWFLDLRGNGLMNTTIGQLFENILSFNSSLVDLRICDEEPYCSPMTLTRLRVNETVRRIVGYCNDPMNAHSVATQGIPERMLMVPNLRHVNQGDPRDNDDVIRVIHLAVQARCIVALYNLVPCLSAKELNQKSGPLKSSALHLCASHPDQWVISLLIAAHANPNTTDRNGDTALHIAMRNSDLALALLLVEYGGSLTLKNRLGRTPLACTELTFLQEEVSLSAARCEAIIISSSDPEERTFARELYAELARGRDMRVSLLTSGQDAIRDLFYRGVPQLYCSTVIAVLPQGCSQRAPNRFDDVGPTRRQAQAFIDLTAFSRQNGGWTARANLNRHKLHYISEEDKAGSKSLTPLVAVAIDRESAAQGKGLGLTCTSALFVSDLERASESDYGEEAVGCDQNGKGHRNHWLGTGNDTSVRKNTSNLSILSHETFRDATHIDLTEWADKLIPHKAAEADVASKPVAFKRRSMLQGMAKRKLGRQEMLERLRANKPAPSETTVNALDDLALRIRAHEKRRKEHAINELLHSIGNLGSEFELRSLIKRECPFAFILDSSGGRYYDLALELRKKLDAHGIVCWPWPHKTMYQAAKQYGSSLNDWKPIVDDLVWDGLKSCKCVINLLETNPEGQTSTQGSQPLNPKSSLHSGLAFVLQTACDLINEKRLPVVNVMLHPPANLKTQRTTVPDPSLSAPFPAFAAPAVTVSEIRGRFAYGADEALSQKQARLLNKPVTTCARSNQKVLFSNANIPTMSQVIRGHIEAHVVTAPLPEIQRSLNETKAAMKNKNKEPAMPSFHANDLESRKRWPSARYEARILELEALVKEKERLLNHSMNLNREIMSLAERYEQRFRDAVQVLHPPKAPSSSAEQVQCLKQELLRLSAGSAKREHVVSTDIFDVLVDCDKECARKDPWTRGELTDWIHERRECLLRHDAATKISSAWRSAWARELLRREKAEHCAKQIQRAYRCYRWKQLAWMY